MPLDETWRLATELSRSDARDAPGAKLVGYGGLDGRIRTFYGDDLSPFVRVAPTDDYRRFKSPVPGYPLSPFIAQYQVKVGPGWLQRVDAFNASPSVAFLLVFDSATPVAVNAVPLWSPIPIPDKATGALVFGDQQLLAFQLGLVVALSSDPSVFQTGAVGLFSGFYL